MRPSPISERSPRRTGPSPAWAGGPGSARGGGKPTWPRPWAHLVALALGLAAGAAVAAPEGQADTAAASAAPHALARGPRLVFWTAGDCSWCQAWKSSDRPAELATLLQQHPGSGFAFVVIGKPRLADPVSAFAWPATPEGAALKASLKDVPSLLPSFDLVCDGRPVRRLTGMAQWDSFWHSQLRTLLKDCAAPAS